MKSLRILWGFALAATAWALLLTTWLLPVPAHAEMPKAPPQQSTLTVVVDTTGSQLSVTGTLTFNKQPIAGATVDIALDAQPIGHLSTGSDGSYAGTTQMPGFGPHVVTALFAGDQTYRGDSATQRFTVNPPATSAPATTAPPPPPTVITAQLAPNPVAAGAVLAVTGNVSAGGVPVDSSRVDIFCDFGGVSALGVTDSGGNFTANLSLPTTGQPSKLTVTVTFAGDNRFQAAKGTFQAAVTSASASPAATPSLDVASTPPPAAAAVGTPTAIASGGTMSLQNASAPIVTFGVVLGIVGVCSLALLSGLWVLAWRRHYLLPGERRGFGSDFGRPRRTSL